jgi:hypothetical protein
VHSTWPHLQDVGGKAKPYQTLTRSPALITSVLGANQRFQRKRAAANGLSGHHPAQIAGLPQMKSGVSAEVEQEEAGANTHPHDQFGKVFSQTLLRKFTQSFPYDFGGSLKFGHYLFACPGTASEFGFSVPNVAIASKDRSDKMAEIPCDVKSQIAGGVRDTRDGAPQTHVVVKHGYLT